MRKRNAIQRASWFPRPLAGITPAGSAIQDGAQARAAFTLIELLVVIAIIAILAALLLPALGTAKQKGQGIMCMNNHRQLTLAWRMYVDDNGDRLPYSMSLSKAWVNGVMGDPPGNPYDWNVELLKTGTLWPYCGNSVGIFKCPGDQSTVRPTSGPLQGQTVPRIRSMSMNYYLGAVDGNNTWPPGSGWRVYLRASALTDPGPSRTWVFLDAREDGITSGGFSVLMTGYPDNPAQTGFYEDRPGTYHNRAGGFSFADGHSEIKKWVDPRTTTPIESGPPRITDSPNNQDIIWMQERSTRKIQ